MSKMSTIYNQFRRLVTKATTKTTFYKLGAIATAVVLGVTGLTFELLSRAATFATSAEAESGTHTSQAQVIAETGASGGSAVKFNNASVVDTAWSDSNPPWALDTGESVDDNRPAGVQVINYDSYSNNNARSFGQTLAAIRSAQVHPITSECQRAPST